jgi:hypothetical protein
MHEVQEPSIGLNFYKSYSTITLKATAAIRWTLHVSLYNYNVVIYCIYIILSYQNIGTNYYYNKVLVLFLLLLYICSR